MDQRELDLAHIRLKNLFFRHPQHDVLTEQFALLFRRARLERELGIVNEMRGIVLIGGSGTGKTTSIGHMFSTYPEDLFGRPGKSDAKIFSFELRGQGGLKGAGHGGPLQAGPTGERRETKLGDLGSCAR